MIIDDPCSLSFHAITQHTGLGVVVELQALHILSRGIQIDIVGEVVDVGVHLYAHHIVVPVDTHIQLIALLRVEAGIATLVAEDVVVDAVGTQFLGNGHTEALANVGLQHPAAQGVVDACRPGDTVKVPVHVGRTLFIDGVACGDRRFEPVMITADVGVGVVQTYAGVQLQPFVHHIAVHGIGTDAGRLEVGYDKAPAVTTVVLILTIQSGTQFVMLAQGESHTEVGGQRVLHETPLQLSVRSGHIAMTHGLAQFLAVIVLPGQVSFPAQAVAVP